MIQETSINAYKGIQSELGERQKQVVNALQTLKVANNREIAQFLKLPINSITPRTLELREKKLITVSRVDKDTITGRQSIFWELTRFCL